MSEPRFRLRVATVDDATALAELRYEFRASVNEPTEDRAVFLERCAPWMRERLAEGSSWRAWLLETDAGPAGCAWLDLIEKVPNPSPELERLGYITSVYVRPELRGRGGGEALVEAALACCREHGVDSVVLWPTDRSRTLYARHGFVSNPGDVMEAVLDTARQVH